MAGPIVSAKRAQDENGDVLDIATRQREADDRLVQQIELVDAEGVPTGDVTNPLRVRDEDVFQALDAGLGRIPDQTPEGRTPVDVIGVVTVDNFPGTQTDALTDAELRATAVPVSGTVAVTGTQTDALTDAQLRATAVPVSSAQLPAALRASRLDAADTFTAGEELTDQAGAGAVLTFTFTTGAMDLIWVRSVGGISRASASGGTPTATKGVYCADDEPTPITLRSTTVSVFAPVGAVCSVWGMRYS